MNTLALGLVMALTAGSANDAPVYIAGGQYSAVLSQAAGDWQLLPIDAEDRKVRSECRQNVHLPPGLWLLNRTADGGAELVAPSGTALPPGYGDRIALVPCDDQRSGALRAPAGLLSWLVDHTGAIWVDE